jgi:hypothetical protein
VPLLHFFGFVFTLNRALLCFTGFHRCRWRLVEAWSCCSSSPALPLPRFNVSALGTPVLAVALQISVQHHSSHFTPPLLIIQAQTNTASTFRSHTATTQSKHSNKHTREAKPLATYLPWPTICPPSSKSPSASAPVLALPTPAPPRMWLITLGASGPSGSDVVDYFIVCGGEFAGLRPAL